MDLTIEELEEAIQNMKMGKARSHVEVTTKMIKFINEDGKQELLSIIIKLNKVKWHQEISK